jgi:hypothetical protein
METNKNSKNSRLSLGIEKKTAFAFYLQPPEYGSEWRRKQRLHINEKS